ncbi:type I restriction enzyme S subunit [Paenibacillus turicensis]|uniref:Restriction endonuclease subunit S n=2 Tax=Paenibacillus TaxID=44249 RepID=A0A919YHZ5_9BACL|nr:MULTISPECIES: restriction endonuclease subunit S [Paenibacillus]MBP1904955.1 type I restriction enzyme S subunit [Paenibacillus turicensis]GIO49595.1 restriction endonuclease subunit S [Paenibacillus azoreducens]
MKILPKLRFSEFTNEWKHKKLGDLTIKVGSGKTPRGGSSVYTDEGVVFIRSQNVLNGQLFLDDVAYISEEENNNMLSTQVYENDILLNITGASIGRSCIVPLGFPRANVNQHVCIIRVNKGYDPSFIMNQIISYKVQKQIDSFQAGGNREGLNFEQIRNIRVSITSETEQRKIASFLSLLNQKVERQKEKIEELELFKKGLLQKIFSQEIRFKDENGQEFPEWDSSVLEELGSFTRNYSFSRSVEGEGEYQHVHYGDIHSKLSGVITSQTELPSLSIDTETTYTLLKDGDVVFADASEDTSDLGKSVVLLEGNNRKIIGGLHTHCFRPYSRLDSLFLHYFTQTTEYRKFINVNANGVSVFGLSKPALSSLEVPLPDIKEQRKISGFLYKLSQKIELLKKKNTELEVMKKGFMNQMFV